MLTSSTIDYRDPDWLRRRYVDERRTMQAMADEAGCLPETIFYWLRKHGIPTRSRSEALSQKRVFTCTWCGSTGTRKPSEHDSAREHFCSLACRLAAESRRKLDPDAKALRVRARMLLNCAVKQGRVAKPTACPSCGAVKRLDAHHEDYTRPLDVHWRCRPCHHREFHPR